MGKKGTKTSVERYPIPADVFDHSSVGNILYSDKESFKVLDKGELILTVKVFWKFDTQSYSPDIKKDIGTYEIKIVPQAQLKVLKNEEKKEKLKENLATAAIIITILSVVGKQYLTKQHNDLITKILIGFLLISLFVRFIVF